MEGDVPLSVPVPNFSGLTVFFGTKFVYFFANEQLLCGYIISPQYLTDLFCKTSSIHDYNTRFAQDMP